ncbi:hypothetical protein BCV69DRAFT_281000 [Microstroma glucosiphilum]|uniref:Uncharacterized protein n=1 Tax=Pseudomicrostroma glucosiphilum TaxID=1684307 RepID=A0A316UEP1_9BASI|nr:hypothetical protein BCV69DRAFT_281000 [Pseudomicrostroma glucosiphilum]PWN23388.1 hypothetical protein BCV69DRAFT_281000 [Pseudomicrostroma glucosiphilum]
MSRAPVPPPLPTAARPKKPAEAPSHAEFLLDQVRASLAQLHQTHALDAVTYRDVEGRLSRAVLKESPPSGERNGGMEVSEGDPEEVKLGKRNAWVRKTMVETDVLPNIVEAALNTVAGPFLSGASIDVIVELVSQSQKSIAEAVTDPKKQQVASTSAFVGLKEAHGGMTRGITAANTTLTEMKQKMEDKRLQAEAKKQEKKERKDLKRELKEERTAIKEQIAAGAGKGEPGRGVTREASNVYAVPAKDAEASCLACGRPMGQVDSKGLYDPAGAARTKGEKVTTVDVTSVSLGPSSSTVTTTFTALPDLRIASTLLISGGHVVDDRNLVIEHDDAKATPTQTVALGREQMASARTESMSSDTRSTSREKPDDRLDPASLNADGLESQNAPRETDKRGKISGREDRTRASSLSDHEAAQGSLQQQNHPIQASLADQNASTTAAAAAPPVPPIPARPSVRERNVSSSDRGDSSNPVRSTDDSGNAAADFGQVVDVTDKKRRGWKNRLLG